MENPVLCDALDGSSQCRSLWVGSKGQSSPPLGLASPWGAGCEN